MNTRLMCGTVLAALLCACSTGDWGATSASIPEWLQPLWCKLSPCRVPARMEISLPAVHNSAETEAPIVTRVYNPTGVLLPDFPVEFHVEPQTAAVVTQGQGLRCTKNAKVVVLAHAGSATASASINCRLVGRLVMADHMRVIMPGKATTAEIEVLDTDNHPIRSMQPTLSVVDPQILQIEQGRFIPQQVGITRVTATAGDRSAETLVTVVRELKAEPLVLGDGQRINYTLPRGSYEVQLKVRSGDSAYGVTLRWVGGRGCEDKAEAQEITSRCTIDTAGSIIIENPTTFGLGPAADGYLVIYEIP